MRRVPRPLDRLAFLRERSKDETPATPEVIPAAELRATLVEAFDGHLEPLGFRHATDLKWTRDEADSIRGVIDLYALKGLTHQARWGVSLDFVPHLTRSGIAWHRTASSSVLDLRYDPLDYVLPTSDAAREFQVHAVQARSSAHDQATEVARRVAAAAGEWLRPVRSLTALVECFEREQQRAAVRFGFDAYAQSRLAFAFTLARAGDRARAEVEFARWASTIEGREADVQRVHGLLESAAAG